MARNLFALLVGINQYDQDSAPELEGCVNDVNAIEDYLKGRIDTSEYQLHIKRLTTNDADEKPTRKAVIEGFEKHLCQAGENDVALFFFSGHGSQEVAAQEFWHLEPDLMNETLVCWDSRTTDWDLADKELGYLLAKVGQENPHILVILDCCHSGSGTRDVEQKMKVRHTRADRREDRSIDKDHYVFSRADMKAMAFTEGSDQLSGWSLPRGRHVVLSACQDSELASEYPGDGKPCGAFSYFMLKVLEKANGTLTYRELFRGASAFIRSRIKNQTPYLEATNISDLDNLYFLGSHRAVKPLEPYFLLKHNGAVWVMEGGAIHGIPQPVGDSISLAVYEYRDEPKQIGAAKVVKVLARESIIEFTESPTDLTPNSLFKVAITSLPLPTLGVYFEGDSEAISLARTELGRSGFERKPSMYVREVQGLAEAQYRLFAADQKYFITKPSDNLPLVEPTPHPQKAVKDLEHIARWNTTAELQNPASRLKSSAVEIQVFRVQKNPDGTTFLEEVKEPICRLTYKSETELPRMRIRLVNRYHKPLYCAILDLPEDYSVVCSIDGSPLFYFLQGEQKTQVGVEANGTVKVEPGEGNFVALAVDESGDLTEDIPFAILEEYVQRGITEYQDILKFIISTSAFDATLLEQEALPPPNSSYKGNQKGGQERGLNSSLNLLMQRVQTRHAGVGSASTIDDWTTSELTVVTVRLRDVQPLAGSAVQFSEAGVTVQPPSGLRGSVRLSTVPQATRDVGSHILPPILRDNTKAFQFTASRGVDPGLSSLELHVDDATMLASVKPESPILVTVEKTLAENEYVLPIAFDGDFYMPLGRGESKNGKTEIRIERLPDPLHEKTKSLAGSVRIFFQKIACEKLGNEFQYPLLAAVDVDEDSIVHYEKDIEAVTQRVAQANKVVLFIHGIIGDTKSMVPSVRHAKISVNGQQKSLAEIYDLVLAFDYENLSTPIQDIAADLKERLVGVGLSPGHGKTFHIVAHSMGGLVSRSFIEQQGGNEIAQHLIMLGTPNAGSPWPRVYDWATTALAIGINGLSTVAFPVKLLGNLVSLLGPVDNKLKESLATIDDNLRDMRYGSTFLSELQNAADPGIPYTILAGNTSIIQPQDEKTKNRLDAFLQKLGQTTLEFPFVGQDNDIAVAVESIKSVPRNRSPRHVVKEVACNHLVYFLHADGLEALSWAVVNTGILETGTSSASIPISLPSETSASSVSGLTVSDSTVTDSSTNHIELVITNTSGSGQSPSSGSNINSASSQTVTPVRPDVDDSAADSSNLERLVGIVVVIVVVLGAIAGAWFWQRSQDSAPNNQSPPASSSLPALTSRLL